MKDSQEKLFFELVQVALGVKDDLSRAPLEKEWRNLLVISDRQGVTGVVFDAINRLSHRNATVKPPFELLMEWIASTEQIKWKNILANKRCVELVEMFREAHFESCILKGQGNAMMYPNPTCRIPGDIDLWVKGKREDIVRYVRERTPNVFEQYHHIDFPIFDDVSVEVHFTPGAMTRPKYNRRFQEYAFKAFDKELRNKVLLPDTSREVCVSTLEFNVVYQMAHMMVHFFDEGVGMRHYVDYFYVLKKCETEISDTIVIRNILSSLGLERFAKGVMWIEKEILGIDDKCLLMEPSERIGTVLLKEMLTGGNFGQYDERYGLRRYGMWGRAMSDGNRLLSLWTTFPQEVTWKLLWKIKNQRWKIKHKRCHGNSH